MKTNETNDEKKKDALFCLQLETFCLQLSFLAYSWAFKFFYLQLELFAYSGNVFQKCLNGL